MTLINDDSFSSLCYSVQMKFGQIHHIEYYVNDLEKSKKFWGWFLGRLGYKLREEWSTGIDWEHESGTYIVFNQVTPENLEIVNNRQGSGLNHIAFQGKELDALQRELCDRGVKILKRKADYLCFEDLNGFAVEIYGV